MLEELRAEVRPKLPNIINAERKKKIVVLVSIDAWGAARGEDGQHHETMERVDEVDGL